MLYPSDIVDRPFGLQREAGLPAWDGDTAHCTHCARPIEAGDFFRLLQLEYFSVTVET